MSNWPQGPCTHPYDDIVEYLFHAPDPIASPSADALSGRVDSRWPRRRRSRRAGRSHRQQILLEQLLGVFLALAPPALVSEIIETATGWPCIGPFRLMGQSAWRRLGREAPGRPNVVFASSDAVFILEMQDRGAKAGQEQVVRDALLVQHICAALAPKRCAVVHLVVAEPDDGMHIRRAAIRRLPRMRRDGIDRLDANARVILADTIAAFELAAMSFAQLDHVLGSYAPAATPVATHRRLIEGLRRQLRFCGLADAPYVATDMRRLAD